MSNVTQEKVVIDADTTGLNKVAAEIDRLAAKLQAEGAKVPKWLAQAQAQQAQAISAVAKASAPFMAASQQAEKRMASLARQSEAVQRQFDTGYKNAARYAAAEERINKLVTAGTLSRERANSLIVMAGEKYAVMGKHAVAANQNVKLTSDQMLNLGRQSGDMATMLAMGASPFQIMSSQAAQVVDALASGPKGLKGSLSAIGASIMSLATPTNLVIGGFAAAAAGAVYFATKSDSNVKDATEALERYRKTLDDIAPGFASAAAASEAAFTKAQMEAPNVALAALRGSQSEMQASLAREIENLVPKTQGFVTSWKDLSPSVLAGQQAIRDIGLELERGQITAAQFRERIAEIRNTATGTEPVIVKIADGILDGSVNARDLAVALRAAAAAAGELTGKTDRFSLPDARSQNDRFGGATSFLKRMNPEGYQALVDGLRSQGEEMTKTAKEANSYSQAVEDQRRSIAGNVDALQRQIDLFGKSEGAIAAAQMQAELLADAERDAAEAKRGSVDPALIKHIKTQSDEYGRLTDRLKSLNEEEAKRKKIGALETDLAFERDQFGRSDLEQGVADRMRSNGLAYGSAADAGTEAQIRFNETMKQTLRQSDEMAEGFKDAFGSVVEAIGSGESALDSIMSALAAYGGPVGSMEAFFEDSKQ